jgi:hypothetical protein
MPAVGHRSDKLTAEWHAAIRKSTEAIVADAPPLTSDPRAHLERNGRGHNVGPRLSPTANWSFFPSTDDSPSTWRGRCRDGQDLAPLVIVGHRPAFDSLSFLNSAGTWSPD